MKNYFLTCYDILSRVYFEDKYIATAIGEQTEDKELITRICYGVVERDYELEYIINDLSTKRPKNAIALVLKIGIYCLKYMRIPDYACVDNTVKLVVSIGKGETKAYVNAIMRKVQRGEYTMPTDEVERLAVESSVPTWLVKKLIKQYGKDIATNILKYEPTNREHIRIVSKDISRVEDMLDIVTKSDEGGYFVNRNERLAQLLDKGEVVYQSPSSMKIARYAVDNNPKFVLDVCAAPGGKSVYMAEISSANITSCDIHPHRVELIRSYAKKVGLQDKINAKVQDATILVQDDVEKYDSVLCDVPCSGIGVRYSKPDVLIRRTESGISALTNIQSKILDVSSKYVKHGGLLTYSTCTILKEENENIIDKFLQKNNAFECIKQETILPTDSGLDGFFVTVMRKK